MIINSATIHSTIMVAIPQEKRGKTYKFIKDTNTKKELPYDISDVTIPEDANFVEVYHDFDGFPDGLGVKIYEGFLGKDFDYVMEHLIAGGNMFSIGLPYNALREADWEDCKPKFSDKMFWMSQSYQYFRNEDGKWFVSGFPYLNQFLDWTEIGKWVYRRHTEYI